MYLYMDMNVLLYCVGITSNFKFYFKFTNYYNDSEYHKVNNNTITTTCTCIYIYIIMYM